MSDSDGAMVGIAPCVVHGAVFEFDPGTVHTVLIDPQTGRPPDVDATGATCKPEPGAVERSVARPVCGPCVRRVNAVRAARGLGPFPGHPAFDWGRWG